MNDITFANGWILWFLLVVPLMVVWYALRYRKQHAALQFSTLQLFGSTKSLRQRLLWLPYALRTLAVAVLIIALARPQSKLSREEMTVEGIDIVLAMDVSGSMLAEDFHPNRLQAAKAVATEFIEGRPNDRIALVVFSGKAFTQVPLTIDHHILLQQLNALKNGMLKDGTAIGDGLATAVNRIKDSDGKSKVIILLTDGENNQGSIDPLNAAEIAALYNIRLYTIGIGSRGKAPYPFKDQFGRTIYQNIDVELDEDLLTRMAHCTSEGRYFRATDKKSLQQIFDQIDSMEKSKIDVAKYAQTKDEHQPLLFAALLILLMEFLLSTFYFKR